MKLSSAKIFAPFKEIEPSSYKRYCVGCSVQTAEVLLFGQAQPDQPDFSSSRHGDFGLVPFGIVDRLGMPFDEEQFLINGELHAAVLRDTTRPLELHRARQVGIAQAEDQHRLGRGTIAAPANEFLIERLFALCHGHSCSDGCSITAAANQAELQPVASLGEVLKQGRWRILMHQT